MSRYQNPLAAVFKKAATICGNYPAPASKDGLEKSSAGFIPVIPVRPAISARVRPIINALLVAAFFSLNVSEVIAATVNFKPPVTASGDGNVLNIGTTMTAYNFMAASTVNGVFFLSTNSTTGTGNLGLSVSGGIYFGGYYQSGQPIDSFTSGSAL